MSVKRPDKASKKDAIDISQLTRLKRDRKSSKNRSRQGKTPFKASPVDSGLQEIIQTEIKSAITTPNSVISCKKSSDSVTMSDRKLLKLRRVSFLVLNSSFSLFNKTRDDIFDI